MRAKGRSPTSAIAPPASIENHAAGQSSSRISMKLLGCQQSHIVSRVSTLQKWFPCGPLLACHLTWSLPSLFLPRSRPSLLATAAEGGLKPAPVSRFRGAYPHQSSSCALLSVFSFRARGTHKSSFRKQTHHRGMGAGAKGRGGR